MALDDLRLSFRDEFNSLSLDTGTAATDANFWNSSMHDGNIRSLSGNNEKQIYMDADYLGLGVNPYSVNNGILTINAAKSSAAVKAATGYDYTSGVLTSEGAFSQTYGYWEVRAQIPEGKGLWSAFWLLNENKNWPPELDVLEAIGSETNWLHQTVHTDTGSATSASTWSIEKLSAGYHTYGMDWTQSGITFYLDGRATYSMATPSDLNTPMYMVLNLAVGGNWPGSPDATTNWANAKYNVDYVRVYEHTGVAGSGGVLNPDGSVYVPPPVSQLAGLIISNGADVTGMTGTKFTAPDGAPSTSKTYSASQLGLGTPGGATLTVSYDAQKNVAATNNGKWNDIKNGAYASDTIQGVSLTNFVGVSVHMNGDQDAVVTVKDAKRGKITTTGGNDRITVNAWSNGQTDNIITIDSGDGTDSIAFAGADNTRAAIMAGNGVDTISFADMANGTANGGAGDDAFVIRSRGVISLTGGSGADSYDLATGNRVTIADFMAGEDSLKLNGIAASAIRVRNASGNSYVDVNNVNIATLSGVTLGVGDLGLDGVTPPPPTTPPPTTPTVTIPTFDSQTAMPTAVLTPESSFTNWPVVHAKLSNGSIISVASGSSFAAAESGANSSRTYSASQIGYGSEAGASATVAYDGSKNATATNNGAWGGIDNIAIRSGAMTKMTVNNFAGIDLDMNGNQHGTIAVNGAKYGSIATGNGNDRIDVTGSSDSASNNLLTISAGNGTNTINYSGGVNNRAAIIAGSGGDTISFAGEANGAINAGGGNDRVNVRSTGNVSITGGTGADVFSFIAGAHATIADFNAGEDRIEFSGVSSSGVQVRNNGTSTVIDLNGQNAVVLAGVSLSAGQINLSYA